MLFFIDKSGTVIKSVPSPVYQGDIGKKIYVVAPYPVTCEATVAFKYPTGIWSPRDRMQTDKLTADVLRDSDGENYSVWSYILPSYVTRFYGTVTVQFFFYAESNGRAEVRASSATSFSVAKGVPIEVPDEPDSDVYTDILCVLSGLRAQMNSGSFAARAIYEYREESDFVFEKGEITFCHDVGEHGAFIRSIKGNNDQLPYIDGEINAEWWEEVVSFDHIATDYFGELKGLAGI